MRKWFSCGGVCHNVVLIVGDYTATVGDPTGKNRTRPMLTHEEVVENSKRYQEQFFKIVDRKKEMINQPWWCHFMVGDMLHTVSCMLMHITASIKFRKWRNN